MVGLAPSLALSLTASSTSHVTGDTAASASALLTPLPPTPSTMAGWIGWVFTLIFHTIPSLLYWIVTFASITLPTWLFTLASMSLTFTMNFTTMYVSVNRRGLPNHNSNI